MAKGVLMDKSTGEPLLVNGQQVTAETKFVPETEDGSVEVVFTFDATGLEGKELVVFETLERDSKTVTTHANIEDEGQTVKFREKEPLKIPFIKTGYENYKIPLIALMIITGSVVVFLIYRAKKKKRIRA